MARVFRILFAAILGTGLLTLVVVLAQSGTAGVEAIEDYAAPIRAGAKVSAEVGGPEAAALTEALRKSKSVTITNFQAQAHTGCFWVDLGGVSATFEMRESGEQWTVVHATLTRDCDCPDPADEPCVLR